jgi:hypothetical protein
MKILFDIPKARVHTKGFPGVMGTLCFIKVKDNYDFARIGPEGWELNGGGVYEGKVDWWVDMASLPIVVKGEPK